MTPRAIVIGLLLGSALAALGYFSDWVLKLTFVAGDLVPVSVFGFLLGVLLCLNPLLRLLRLRPLTGRELAVIVALLLVAVVIPGPGLMWNFCNVLIMPHQYAQVTLDWQKQQLMQMVPPVMLADVSGDYSRDMIGFGTGLRGTSLLSPAEVPWHAWSRTLSFWLPLVALCFLGTVAMTVTLHRHWSRQEHLRFPVAALASELLREADGSGWPALFRNRRFWIGFALAAGVLTVNGAAAYFRSQSIPLSVDLRAMVQKWPVLGDLPFPLGEILAPRFFFAAVGLAYFVSSEVSLSVGLSTVAYAAVYLVLVRAGLRMGGDYFGTGGQNFLLAGAYVGMAVLVFYTGRRFYLSALAGAVGFLRRPGLERETIWSTRLALAAGGAMVIILCVVGLEPLPAVLLVALLAMMFMVITRINAEAGLFFIQPTWQIAPVVAALLGWPALGPKALLIVGLVSVVLAVDPRVCLMPMVANALQISQEQRLRPARVAKWMVPAILLALICGVAGTLYVHYNYGSNTLYDWANLAARQPFDLVSRNFDSFGTLTGEPSLANFHPETRLLSYAGVGLALVVGCGLLRLRLPWWPIHPVLFLVWGTLSSAWYGPSFLLGWLLKSAIVKFGGSKSFEAAKPVFVGLVAGEFFAAILWAMVGLAHYLHNGTAAATFRTHL